MIFESKTDTGAKVYVSRTGAYPFVKIVVPWDEAILVPFGDMHIGGGFNEVAGEKARDYVLGKENALALLLGDIIQNGNKRVGDMVFKLDMIPKEQKEYCGEFFSPIKSRIVGSVTGNHENWSFRETGDDMAANIMTTIGGVDWAKQFYMGAEWFGSICNKKETVCYTIYGFHGKGHHKTSGLAVNTVRRDTGDWLSDFDVRVRGHSHDCAFDFESLLKPNVKKMEMDDIENYVVFCGHFQWRPDSYVAIGGLRPKPLGTMAIVMDMRMKAKGSVRGERVF